MSEDRKLVMTPEIQAKLAKLAHFTPAGTFPWTPKAFRDPANGIPAEYWPVYTLRHKDGLESAQGEASAVEMGQDGKPARMRIETGARRVQDLVDGCAGFRNVRDNAGNLVEFKFKDGKMDPDLIRGMPVDLQVEMQEAINTGSKLTPEELRALGF